MEHAVTRGQRSALAAIEAMVVGGAPHAVLLTGPPSVGKTTLAFDLAAGLLCVDPDVRARPCRACRGCRQVASGNHPDLHRLVPEGAGGQIRIGKPLDPEPGTVRNLVSSLALLPVEGGARVAIVESAQRMNEDAQNALLKTLEEPPPGVTIVLCADDEERLLPTVRSRCVRIRLGPVATREIELWLGDLDDVDAPEAGRCARLSAGRPGLALAYARSPDAARLRGELSRGLLDLLVADRRTRLASVRALMATAGELNVALAATIAEAERAPDAAPKRRRGSSAETPDDDGQPRAGTASDRRASAATLLDVWAAVARDVLVVARGAAADVADVTLLEELTMAARAGAAPLAAFIRRIGEVSAQLDENANPELAMDVLALSWPRIPVAHVAATA